MKYTGKLISIAFPDTFVRFSDEWISRLFPVFGFGKKGMIKAGHAACILIENTTGEANYYDFGRYITPPGFGRVRSAKTDAELKIPFRAELSENKNLKNLDDFLIWLEQHPEKTHGQGKVIASVCDYINFEKAEKFLKTEQRKGNIPYHTFAKTGSNCSRIVTDTLLNATNIPEIRKPLLRNKKFSPSPLGNVVAAAYGSPAYEVINQIVKKYSAVIFKENLLNFLDKKIPNHILYKKKNIIPESMKGACFLEGVGSSAYFKINQQTDSGKFEMSRFTEEGVEDFRGIFSTNKNFNISKPYSFTYDSNCAYCHIEQDGQRIRFDLENSIEIDKKILRAFGKLIQSKRSA